MTLPHPSTDRSLRIYLALAQYPILRTQIREVMRRELFNRGVITPKAFEAEVREKAIQSQAREGLHDPMWEESEDLWETRLARIRSHLTDFYFSYNLQYDLFEQIVRDVLSERVKRAEDIFISFNPELAPQAAGILQQVALSYDPHLTSQARDRDFLHKVALAKELLSVTQLRDLRQQSLALLNNHEEVSWERVDKRVVLKFKWQ